MKSHVFRPLMVFIGLVAIVLIARQFIVPEDFGIGERGYMYGWHRTGNEQDWKEMAVQYKSREYCRECHDDKYSTMLKTPHAIIQCENCHGPAGDHPLDPQKLDIDKSRGQCLRCHTYLPYPTSGRMNIKGIDPDAHNPDIECVLCHNPHKPNVGSVQ